jgi:hypothetical protein
MCGLQGWLVRRQRGSGTVKPSQRQGFAHRPVCSPTPPASMTWHAHAAPCRAANPQPKKTRGKKADDPTASALGPRPPNAYALFTKASFPELKVNSLGLRGAGAVRETGIAS